MKLNEMVLVTENWKGTEINSLMKLEDFLVLADVENMETRNDVAQVMTKLGRTLGDKEAAVQSMYKEFGTGKEDTFYDNLEEGKYDSRFTGQFEKNMERSR